jgi:hypothetical protein
MEVVENISDRLVASKITETDELYISRLAEQPRQHESCNLFQVTSTTNHGEFCLTSLASSEMRRPTLPLHPHLLLTPVTPG